jgi:prepilin-type N-terminal cleavage/methylation domain-containing protein
MIGKQQINKKGFTLVELVVTVAILAVASVIMVTTYTNVMANQRMKADMASLSEIDDGFKNVFLYDDAFEEVKAHVHDENKFTVKFPVCINDSQTIVSIQDAVVSNTGNKLKDQCDIIYEYLVEYVGTEIELESSNYKDGFYEIYITFNGTKVSDVRDYVINNDNVLVSNSGDEYFTDGG